MAYHHVGGTGQGKVGIRTRTAAGVVGLLHLVILLHLLDLVFSVLLAVLNT